MKKTNAIRLLDRANIPFKVFSYTYDEDHLSGQAVAAQSDLPPEAIFKTLVGQTNTREHIVMVIPVNTELDLKLCARAADVKRVELIAVRELLPLTGYVRGGCSPVGMKKLLRTFIDQDCLKLEEICVSAGKRGLQICLAPQALIQVSAAQVAHLSSSQL